MPSALALAALAFGWQSPPCQACPLQWCKKWPCSTALLEVVEVDKVTSTPHLSHHEHSMVLRWSLMPSGGTACFIFWRQNSFSLSCLWPSTWYPDVPMHPCHPYPTKSWPRNACLRCSTCFLQIPWSMTGESMFKPNAALSFFWRCTPATWLFNVMYSPTVHWSSQVIIGSKHTSAQILETYGAALVKPCQVTAMLPFLGHCFQSQHHDPIHPEKSNLGKMTQLGALHKKVIESCLTWYRNERGGATRHWIISSHMNIEHTVLVCTCTGLCFKLESLVWIEQPWQSKDAIGCSINSFI